MYRYEFSAPGYYRIVVQGQLRSGWSERLGEMVVVPHPPQQDKKVTVLQGRVSDQAELSGILNTFYELHMPLLSIQYLGDELSSSSDSDDTGVRVFPVPALDATPACSNPATLPVCGSSVITAPSRAVFYFGIKVRVWPEAALGSVSGNSWNIEQEVPLQVPHALLNDEE